MRAQVEDVAGAVGRSGAYAEVQRLVSIGGSKPSPDRWSGVPVVRWCGFPVKPIRDAILGCLIRASAAPGHPNRQGRAFQVRSWCRWATWLLTDAGLSNLSSGAGCAQCGGGCVTSGHAIPSCGRCGRLAADWVCPECGGRHLRPFRPEARAPPKNCSKAFLGVEVVTSDAEVGVIGAVDAQPRLVVATLVLSRSDWRLPGSTRCSTPTRHWPAPVPRRRGSPVAVEYRRGAGAPTLGWWAGRLGGGAPEGWRPCVLW